MQTSWDTPTMAELFVKQGHPRRALGIYRKVVRDRPHDAAAQRRLSELEAHVAQGHNHPMNFREHMQHIVDSVPGATACALMGYDGIAIDSYEVGGSSLDVPTLLIEYWSATQALRTGASAQPMSGTVNELTINTDTLTAVLRPLNNEYFLAVVLTPEAVAGKARYLMRLAAPLLLKDLV